MDNVTTSASIPTAPILLFGNVNHHLPYRPQHVFGIYLGCENFKNWQIFQNFIFFYLVVPLPLINNLLLPTLKTVAFPNSIFDIK